MAQSQLERLILLNERFGRQEGGGTSKEILTWLRTRHDIVISDRTLKRDIDILRRFGVEIEFDRRNATYVNRESGLATSSDAFFRQVELSEMRRLILQHPELKPYVGFDRLITDSGSEHIGVLLKAIRERIPVEIGYRKYDGSPTTRRDIEPYYLQEFDRIWYVHAIRVADRKWRVYGLDRIQSLMLKPEQRFTREDINVEERFRSYIGINGSGEEIRMKVRFSPYMGQLVKHNKLHPDQEIVAEDSDGVVLALHTRLNNELMMTLFKYHTHVTILEPAVLRDRYVTTLRHMMDRYGA